MKKVQCYLIFFILFFIQIHTEQPNLHICTSATDLNKGLNQLLESCRYQNIQIEILGFQIPFQGLAHKLIFVQNYLETLPDSDVVMFVDGYDVLILSDAETILNKFLEMNSAFIIAGERYCWPLLNRRYEFPQQSTSFQYLNSGGYIGYVHAIKSVFNSISPINPKDDDQGLLSAFYLDHPGEIQIDDTCQFFLTLAGVSGYELKLNDQYKLVRIKETRTTPFVIHGNGGSRPLYQYVYDRFFPTARY